MFDLFDFPEFSPENETLIPENTKEDLNFLEVFFEPLIQFLSSFASNSSLINFHKQLKSNQFKLAIQTVKDNPRCLQQMNSTLTVAQLAQFLVFLLRKRLISIIKSMWEKNSQLASYFSGKPTKVQITNEQGVLETQTWQLPMKELIANFKAALASQCPTVIKSMWENNLQLESYFNGERVEVQITNEQGVLETQTWQLPMKELIANFKAALVSRTQNIIKSMWKKNPQLELYFSGERIEVQITNEQGMQETQIWRLPIKKLIANFKTALASRTSDIIESMWERNFQLTMYFSGKPTKVEITNEQGVLETQTWQLPMTELIANFKAALASRTPNIFEFMWNYNPQLASYFSGKLTKVQITNEQGVLETQIPMTELIANFKAALASQSIIVIESMWKNNLQLASYFSGKPTKVEITNEQGVLETQTRQLPMTELIANFKAALASRNPDIIKSMWESNSLLQDAVKNLDATKLTELIEKVLSSSTTKKSEFIPIFLNSISNKDILEACLNKKKAKKQSYYVKNQVAALNTCLASLDSSSAPPTLSKDTSLFSPNRSKDDDDELNDLNDLNDFLDQLAEDDITRYSDSSPLTNNSMFKNNKRSHEEHPSGQNKFQKK